MKVNTIVVYDVAAGNGRTRNALKKWLYHQQRSVFVGYLTAGQRIELAAALAETVGGDGESILMLHSGTTIETKVISGKQPDDCILA